MTRPCRGIMGLASAISALALMIGSNGSQSESLEQKTFECAGLSVAVSGASLAEQQAICLGASKALRIFAQCGVSSRKHIRITVVRSFGSRFYGHAFDGHIYAFFDNTGPAINILDSAALEAAIPTESYYSVLTSAELYESISAHEMAHALLWQNAKGHTLQTNAQEYLAFAVQIASMTPEARGRLLSKVPRGEVVDLSVFNAITLNMAREYFAALAYEHFRRPENHCRMLQSILLGQLQFPESPMYDE